jgi:hypothetical protein
MVGTVHRSYEAYIRRDDGGLIELSDHILASSTPEVGARVYLRRSRAWTEVVAVDDSKVVVEFAAKLP